MNNAGVPFVHIRNHEPLETRKNQNELLLQEDALLFLLQCKHLFTPSNFTSAACLFATSEGRLYRSYIGFFRTDIPSRIGGWPGTALAVLFPPPSSEPDVLVFKHPALQFPILSRWPVRISRSRIRF